MSGGEICYMLLVIQMENASFDDLRNTLGKNRILNLQQVGKKNRNLNFPFFQKQQLVGRNCLVWARQTDEN